MTFKRDITCVQIPRGVRMGCRSKRKRIRTKLAKRHGVYHHRDRSRVSVMTLRDAYPIAMSFDQQGIETIEFST